MREHLLISVAVAGLVAAAPAASTAASDQTPSGRIAFESTRTGDSDIWIMTADGTDQVDLTKTPRVQESTPALSPDGKRIAFVRSTGRRYALWVMNVDGSGRRPLGHGRGSDLNPVWSPRGNRIAFASLVGRNWDLYVTTLAGKRTQLTRDSAAEVDASWSPQGNRLVFDRIARGKSDLWLISPTTRRLVPLTKTPKVAELNPAWSPKGNEIAYDASVNKVYDLFAVDVSTRKVRRLTNDAADDGDPAWAPDASGVVFRRSVGPDDEVAVVSSSGGGIGKPQNVSHDPAGLDIAPSWSKVAGALSVFRRPAHTRRAGIYWVFACDAAWPGTAGADNYTGNANVNYMCGDGGSDTIHGGDNGDWVSGGSGTDYLYGDAGGDKLKARDSTKDSVYGGSGTNYALLDAADSVTSVQYPSY